eukprot:3167380-Rhodomonas_salina.1
MAVHSCVEFMSDILPRTFKKRWRAAFCAASASSLALDYQNQLVLIPMLLALGVMTDIPPRVSIMW